MTKRTVAVLAVLLLAFQFAVGGGDTDQKALQGTWKVTKLVSNGTKDETATNLRITFKGKTFAIADETGVVEQGTYKHDAIKKPKHIDFAEKKPAAGKEKPVLGIYKLEGDTLTICLAKEGTTKRPTNFTSEKGSERTIFTLQRVKK